MWRSQEAVEFGRWGKEKEEARIEDHPVHLLLAKMEREK